MIDILKSYLDGLFAILPNVEDVIEAKSRLYGLMKRQYKACLDLGMNQQAAYQSAIEVIGDVSNLIARLQKEARNPPQREENAEGRVLNYLSPPAIRNILRGVTDITSGFFSVMWNKALPSDLKLVNSLSLPLEGVTSIKVSYTTESITLNDTRTGKFVIREYMNHSDAELFADVEQNVNSIKVKYGRRKGISLHSRIEIDVPPEWKGTLSVSTIYGDIGSQSDWDLSNLYASTIGGNINLKSVRANNIKLSSSVGALILNCGEGNMQLSTVSGDIHVQKALGGGIISTIAGDTSVYFEKLYQPVKLSSENGDIFLHLSPEVNSEVDIVSLTGSINSSFDTIINLPGLATRNAHGQVGNAPYQSIEISTSTGGVHINK